MSRCESLADEEIVVAGEMGRGLPASQLNHEVCPCITTSVMSINTTHTH